MRKTWCAAAAALTLWAVGAAQSGEEAGALALVQKAIDAQGGADNLAKFHAASIKGKGTFYGQADEGVPFIGEWLTQGQTQMRISILIKLPDQSFKLLKIVNGDQGWERLNDDKAQPMGKDKLVEERAQMYASWVASLVPLVREKGFKLTTLPEAKVGDKLALGVKVSREGQRDVKLYFDKATGLLAKSEMTIKDVESGANKDMLLEIVYDNYKDVGGGARQPLRMAARRDGKKYIEGDLTEFKAETKLDDKAFGPP